MQGDVGRYLVRAGEMTKGEAGRQLRRRNLPFGRPKQLDEDIRLARKAPTLQQGNLLLVVLACVHRNARRPPFKISSVLQA